MLALLAPGQGSQSPGFLSPWLEDAKSTQLLSSWSDAIGLDLTRLGTTADADEIRNTENAQPLIVAGGLIGAARLFDTDFSSLSYVAGHSVGTLIRRSLHEEIGYYSRKYPIAADHLFLELALLRGVVFEHGDFIAGKFGDQGVSSKDKIGALTEAFRIQMSIRGCKLNETIIFIMRLIWNYKTL